MLLYEKPAPIPVSITAEHISTGVPGDAFNCPVALALKSATGHLFGVCRNYCQDGPFGTRMPLPDAVWRWTIRFDTGLPVEPFSFQLELPVQVSE